MAKTKTVRALWLLGGSALAAACGSGSASAGGASGGGGGVVEGTGGAAAASSVSSGGTASAVEGEPWVEEGTAGAGLVSSVFGDPLSLDSGQEEPALCTHPSPGTCDWARVDEGCCSRHECINATADPDDSWPIEACQALVDCIRANPGCSGAEEPLCSARNGDQTSPCTAPYENAGSEDPGTASVFVREAVACVCGY